MKKVLVAVSVLLVLSMLAWGCAAPAPTPTPTPAKPTPTPTPTPAPAPAEPEVFEWKISAITPPADIGWEGVWKYMCGLVEERSNGRLILKYYHGNELVKVGDNFDAVSKGISDMMYGTGAYWTGIQPELYCESGLPYSYTDQRQALACMEHEGLTDLMREVYAEHNIYLLQNTPTGKHGLMSNVPIRKIEDYKGLQARCTGPQAELVTALGGSTVFITGAEVYTALQLGTVDASTWTMQAWSHMNFQEVAEYYCLPSLQPMVVHLCVNMDSWNSLPDDLKDILHWSAWNWVSYNITQYHDVEMKQENYMRRYEPDRICELSAEDQAKVQQVAFGVWDDIAAKSPRTAQAVEIIRSYLTEIGVIE